MRYFVNLENLTNLVNDFILAIYARQFDSAYLHLLIAGSWPKGSHPKGREKIECLLL